MLNLLKFIGYRLFRILFQVEYRGIGNVPATGPVILAGNHPSYLDPALVVLPLDRTVRYMAWDALFKIPLFGHIIRRLGAFPVDIRRGRGESAFREAKRILESGEALGIFPEGQRSERGPMGEMKTGTARLAVETGAVIVPVTIGGASRAWPKQRLLPKPAKIIVRYHEPIRLDPAQIALNGQDRDYHLAIMQDLAGRINRSLEPALRGDRAWERWYRQPPSHLRTYEWVPLMAALVVTALALARREISDHAIGIWLPATGYYLYLIADLSMIAQTRTAKWLRNSVPVWLIFIWHAYLTRAAGITAGIYNGPLAIFVLAVFFLFFYENYLSLQKFVRGLVVTYYVALLLLLRWSEPRGMITAILLFVAIYCLIYRVLYRWVVAAAAMSLLVITFVLSGNPGLSLWPYVILPCAVVIYLQSFINAAYDIRQAGDVKAG